MSPLWLLSSVAVVAACGMAARGRLRAAWAETSRVRGELVAALADLARTREDLALAREDAARLGAQLSDARVELAGAGAELGAVRPEAQSAAQLRVRLAEAERELAVLQSTAAAQREAHAERLRELRSEKEQIDQRVKTACVNALGGSSEQLLALARAQLATERVEARRERDVEHERIGALFTDVSQTLGKVSGKLEEIERERLSAREQLDAQLRNLRDGQGELLAGTQALVGALSRPHVRGRWGEVQLRTIIESTGMLKHVDFDEQPSIAGEDGTLRPDACIHLPGGRDVIVDAKVPLDAYLQWLSATDAGERERLLAAHARHVRTHLVNLDSKSYWERLSSSPDFVVMFVPNDQVLLAAMDADRTLAEEVQRRRVVVATPMSLMALLRIVALGWRQEMLTANALEIERLGRELHGRLGAFAGKLNALGGRLGSLVRGYNEAVGSFELRVLPSARRLAELGAVPAEQLLPSAEPVTVAPRELRAPELSPLSELRAG